MDKKDELSKPLSIISSVLPPVGLVLYVVNRKEFPNRAKTALISGLIGIPIGLLMGKYVVPFLGDFM